MRRVVRVTSFAEQVGESRNCDNCGELFILKANSGRVAWQIIAATIFVLALIGGLLARGYWGSHRFETLPTRAAAASFDRAISEIDDN